MSMRLAFLSWLLSAALAVGCGADDGNSTEAEPQPRPPAAAPPSVSGLEAPPPAWLETQNGSYWLGFSTFCWKGGCADYTAPSCRDGEHVPKIGLRRAELVTAHLGFEPREVMLTYFSETMPPGSDQQTLTAGRDPEWRIEREGAFSLFAIATQGGDASYVGCVTLE